MTQVASPPPIRRRRRRARIVIYSLLGFLALVAIAMRILSTSGVIERRLRDRVESTLADALGRKVTVESIQVSWLPPGGTAGRIVAEDGDLTIDRVTVDLSLRALIAGRAVIRDMDVHRPVVRWDLDAGSFLPPRTPRDEPPRVTLDRLRVHDGAVRIGSDRRSFSAVLEGVSIQAANSTMSPTGPWDGSIAFQRGTLRAGDFAFDGIRGAIQVEADKETITTRRIRLRAEGIDVHAEGSVRPGAREAAFDIRPVFMLPSPALRRLAPSVEARRVSLEARLIVTGGEYAIEGTWDAEAPSYDPDRDDAGNGPRVALSGTRAAGTLRAGPGSIAIDGSIQGVGGGVATLALRTQRAADPEGTSAHRVTGTFEGVDPAAVLAMYDLPGRDAALPSTRASGDLDVSWSAGALREGRGAVDLRFRRAPGDVPLGGTAGISWQGPRFTIRHAALETTGTAVSLRGTVDTTGAAATLDMQCDLEASDTVALMALIERRFPLRGATRSGGREPILRPRDASGRLSAHLRLTGTTRAPRVNATFASDWMTVDLPVAGDPGRRVPVAIHEMEGTVDYAPDRLSVRLDRAAGDGLEVEGDLEIDPGAGTTRSLRIRALEIPAALAAQLAGIDPEQIPLQGTMSGGLDLVQGAPGALEGPVEIEAPYLSAGPIEMTRAHAHGSLRAGLLEIDEVSFEVFGGTVAASGAIPLAAGDAGAVDLSAEGIDLARLDDVFGGPSYEGRVDVRTRLAIDGLVGIEGTVSGRGIEIGGVPLGDVSGLIGGTTDRMTIAVADPTGTPSLDARIALNGGAPEIEATVRAERFSLERIRPVLPPGALPGLRGDADGVVTVRGPLRDPGLIEARAVLDRISLTAGDYPLHNDGTVRLTLSEGFATLAPMRLVGEKTDMRIGGTLKLTGEKELSAHVTGAFDLGILEVIMPTARASGPGRADIRVIERGDGLTWSGTVHIDDGRIAHPSLPLPILGLRAAGRFEERGLLVVEEIACSMGGGKITGSGSVRFLGARLPEGRFDLAGRGITSEIGFPGLRAFFDADTVLTIEGGIYRAAGEVRIQRAVYSRPFGVDTGDILTRSREFGPARDLRNGGPVLLLDLDVIAEGGLWVRNDDALIEAEADLALRGTLDQPELTGNLTAFEGGTYRFRDVTYRLVSGSLDFVEVDRIDPRLNIEAVSRVRNYEITLRITGTVSKPVYDLSSDPALSQPEIVWLLITGQDPSDPSYGGTQISQAEVAGYLAAPVTHAVTAPLAKIPGVTSVRIDPYFLEGTADPSARATVTSKVSENLQVTYSTSLDEQSGDIYQVEYNRGRLWDLIATRDEDGSVGGDIRFRRRWRGRNPFSREIHDPVEPEPDLRVGSITLVADHLATTRRHLLDELPFREGSALRRGDLLEGRENLRIWYARHGFPMAEVDVLEAGIDPQEPVRRDVTYVIRAGPRHSLRVTSDRDARNIRRRILGAWQDTLLMEDLIEAARTAALEALWERGHARARAEVSVEESEAERRIVLVDVEAGPKVRVEEIAIRGNHGIPEDRIRRQLLTRGTLKRDVLREDLGAIRALYMSEGYLSVVVHDPEIAFEEDGTRARITIPIDEGTRWTIDAIAIEGEAAGVPGESLIRATGLTEGQPLPAGAIGDAAERVRLHLDREGYPEARVETRLEGIPVATRMVFSIHPGDRSRIASVRVEGNTRTRDRIIDREITLTPGEPLSRAAMLQTQANLYRLGVFRTVRVEPTPLADDPGRSDVTITVREGSPILTGWGVGYDSEDRLRGSLELGHNNLFGTRRSAAIFLRGSSVDSRIQTTLRDPNLFGERIESLWSAFIERREFESFDEERLGVSVQLQRPLTDHLRLFGNYRLEDVDLSNLRISPEEAGVDDVRLGSFAISGVFDSRNDILNPSRGTLSSLEVRFYGESIGSDESFMRYVGRYSRFRSLGRRVVWAWALRGGVMSSRVPTSERFYAGGDTTVRGFDRDTLGPEDPVSGKPVGGNAMILLNQELRFPIWRFLNGVVFYDTGNVWSEAEDVDLGELRDVIGAGLRFDTPIGPLRVEYGHKMDREEGESAGRFFFSIGQAF